MGAKLMAALPYMPLFVADYLADTAHLNTFQHGAYLLLIMNYWQRGGPLPDDDKRLASIARVGPREWARMRDVISEFFSIANGSWSHSRIDVELARVEAKSLKSKKAAQASVERRLSERSAPVEPTDTDKNKKEEKIMPDKSGDYAFFGQTIKLAPRHLDQWRRLFHSIPDIEAELSTLDDWWQAQPEEKRGNWFLATKGMLNKRHQENLAVRRDYDGERITV
jgi:uncharacterized protein YdaU (DUF1376 family)